MPELPILDGEGALLPIAPLVVVAVSAYPDDQGARSSYLSSLIVKKGGLVDPPLLAAMAPILNRSAPGEELERRAQKATGNAWTSALALFINLSVLQNHPEIEIDPTRAFSAIARVHPKEAPSARTLWRLWPKFRKVSHLKLALDQMLGAGHFSQSSSDAFDENFLELLGRAEAVRRLAEERRVVPFGESWSVPSRLTLPVFDFRAGPLPENVLQALREYVPEHSEEGIEE